MIPLVSIVIPVCNVEEKTLHVCLQSICGQTFSALEVVVIDDNKTEAEQKKCKLSVKNFCKLNKKNPTVRNIKYISEGGNYGLIEARRLGFESAQGKYCMTVDADDKLASENAVAILYNAATTPTLECKKDFAGFDMTQCGCIFSKVDGTLFTETKDNNAENPIVESFYNQNGNISSFFFAEGKHSYFMWAKMYKTEKVLEAFNQIPNMYCVYAEDFLQTYFFTKSMCSYNCIKDKLYNYTVQAGVTSNNTVTTLERWKKLCSVSSVFTTILYDLQENPIPEDSPVFLTVKKTYFNYITSNALQLVHEVDPSIYEDAKSMFIEAWGEENALKAIDAASKM